MNKKIVTLISLFLLIFFVNLNLAFAENPEINVNLMRIEPFPVEPSQIVELWIQVENKGLSSANVKTSIEDNYFYTIVENAEKNVIIQPGESIIVRGKIKIKPETQEGTHKLKFSVLVDNNVKVVKEFDIDVFSVPEIVVVDSTKEVEAQKENEVKVVIENIKSSLARDVVMTISSEDFDVIGTNKVFIGDLKSREQKELNLVLYPLTEKDVGTLMLKFTYNYGQNEVKNDEINLGIKIVRDPLIELSFLRFENNEAVLEVINKGEGVARFLTVTCENAEPRINYIGNLESDDFETFTIKTSENKVKCYVEYKTNKYFEREFEVELGEREVNNNSNSKWYLAIAIIVVVLIIFFWIRRKKQ